MSESTIIVDINDKILGHKPRNEISHPTDIYRVSWLRITNQQGDILLAQRSFNKKHDPWLRWPAVAWTNAEGEIYETNILKEAEEELWLKDIQVSKWPKRFVDDWHRYRWQRFTTVIDLPIDAFILQENEVAQVKWITPAEIKNLFLKQPEIFIPSFKGIVQLFLP